MRKPMRLFVYFIYCVQVGGTPLACLKRLFTYPEFRYVRTRTKPCLDRAKCSTRSCSVSKYITNGTVDILGIKEEYTGRVKNGSQVWKDIYTTSRSKELTKLISGIHFSVTAHIARNYTKVLLWYVPNPNLYFNKFKKEYKTNFFNLFSLVESSISDLTSENLKIERRDKEEIRFFILYSLFLRKLKEEIANKKEVQGGDSQRDGFVLPSTNFKEILSLVDCVDCDKCKILGNLQFEGLKEALKVKRNKKISTESVVYLLAFYRKLCQTVDDVSYLESLGNCWFYKGVYVLDLLGYLFLTLIFMKVIRFLSKTRV